MGKLEPEADRIPHEVGVLFEVTAEDQVSANTMAATLAHFALHYPIPGVGRPHIDPGVSLHAGGA